MKPTTHTIKWSLIFVGASLLWMLFEKAMGWHGERIDQHLVMTNLFALVAITVFVLAIKAKRKELGGVMSWKEGFLAGLWVSVGVAVLSPLSQWVTHTLISPGYFPNVIEFAVETGQATREEAEAFFNLQNYMTQSALGAILMGAITSAAVALFMRRKAPRREEEESTASSA